MVKGFRQIASLTAFSRVLGLIRDMAFSYFLGASGLMDSWVIAFKIPNLTRRLFGEGAASASFIPIYSEQLHHDPHQANRLASTVITVVFLILAGVVLAGEIGIWTYYTFFTNLQSTKLMLALTGIMLPYMVLICVVALLGGVLNSHRHFAAPAAAPIVLNIFIIGSLCFTGWVLVMTPSRQVFIVAAGVMTAGLVQMAIQMPPLRARGISIRPAWGVRSEAFKKILLLMGPMVLGLTVTQINTLADDIIAKCLSGSAEKGEFFAWFGSHIKYPVWDGAVSKLYYSQRLYQFPLGVLGISLATAIFPVMSAQAAKKDFEALRRTISRGLRGAVFVAVPATVGLILIARPLASAIFERGQFTSTDTKLTAWTLSFYALGLCGYFCQQIVTRAFYSMQDSKMPAYTALAAVFTNITLNLTLIWFMGTAGLALSTAICSYLQVVILVFVLRARFGCSLTDGLLLTALKTITATAFMGFVGWGVLTVMKPLPISSRFDILRLTAIVPASVIAYAAAARLLKVEMLSLVTGSRQN
ncbi:MAG: murein biosynthesis integral membrane protein MurJ [Planctomycetota bacterium]|jgi:putative peptidoglycan lipid II flippase